MCHFPMIDHLLRLLLFAYLLMVAVQQRKSMMGIETTVCVSPATF